MPLTEKQNNTVIFALRKLGEYGAIFLAVWQLGIPAAEKWTDGRIDNYNKVHSGSKKSFREALSDKLQIPVDEVVIEISKWYNSTEKFRQDFYTVLPHIEEELEAITPRLVIINGREFWVAEDGEYYRVSRDNEQQIGFYYKGGSWHQIFY